MKRALTPLALLAVCAVSPAVFPNKTTTGYKPVGMMGSTSTGAFKLSGGGVAISPEWVVGVAHVGGNVFVQNGQQYPIVQKVIHKTSEGEPADIALYKLGKPVLSYAPILLAPFDAPGTALDLKGRTVTMVGYGRTATVRPDGIGWLQTNGSEGTKRATTNRIDQVSTERYNIGTELAPKWKSTVCLSYDLDKPGDPSFSTLGTQTTPDEGGIAARDSGGGWFVYVNNQNYLVAVSATVGRLEGSTLPTDYSYGAMGFGIYLAAYKDWIFAVTGLPQFGPNTTARGPNPAWLAALALATALRLRPR